MAARLASRPGEGVFGAFEGNDLVGIVGLSRDARAKLAHKGHIWGMYVAPSARHHGLARQLLEQALALARATVGVSKVVLHVDAANVHAIALYESLGFVVYGREPDAMRVDGQVRDELQMALRFEPAASRKE